MNVDHAFDVYATPFVPEALRHINQLSGRFIHDTESTNRIDFGLYSSLKIPFGLLPTPVPPAPAGRDDSVHASGDLGANSDHEQKHLVSGSTQKDYARFFKSHLDDEIAFQCEENASYSLYGHEGIVEFIANTCDAQVTISVPGLRENSPHVEEDDIVQLRQLRCDHAGHLISHPDYAPWTETIYNARVLGVLRAKEILVLRVSNLNIITAELMGKYSQHVLIPSQHRLKFNIAFPVAMERYMPMINVLPQIQAFLEQASSATYKIHFQNDGPRPHLNMNEYWIQSMLFPTEADCDSQNNLQSGHTARQFFDQALNVEQRIAVENVCRQNYGVIPYLISGPPGTGKTKTIIETALQLIKAVPNVHHIILCAPSEPAADTLAHRLMQHMGKDEMFRLNRPSRGFGEVSDQLLGYCYIEKDVFALPPIAQLLKYKIVVTSCRDASLLMYARLTNSDLYAAESGLLGMIHPTDTPPAQAKLHWDALLIDEAAQSMEPESLVPLFVVAPPPECPELVFTPVVVMAGDENQLTPRTSSPRTPLQRSLFARLFSRPVFANHPLARRLTFANEGQPPPPPPTLTHGMLPILRPPFTNLIQNYRSHPAVLAVPSRLFYYDTLEAQADPQSTNILLSWSEWPRKRTNNKPCQQTWPILFRDNVGQDDLERDNGGWFNPVEAELACRYAKKLADSGLVPESQICIMTPFKAQVRRIRKLARLPQFNLWDVNIGPTEAYQGLEYDVVILCVTRSRRKFVEKDKQLGWGIIGQRNQLNVALTRAKAGLIMIGNGELLKEEDECWREMVQFCERNGCVDHPAEGDTGGSADVPPGDEKKDTGHEEDEDDEEHSNGETRVGRVRNRLETMMLDVESDEAVAAALLN